MNEKTIELIDIAPKDFWGAQDTHLETIKKYYPQLKIVARGTTLKVFGEKEQLNEFETRFHRLMLHFSRYNNIDNNVIERVIMNDSREVQKMADHDRILVHGVGGKIIKAMTPNQQLLVDTINKCDMVFAVGPAGTGKTYTGVAMAVKALKEKAVKKIILTRPAVEAGENLGFLPGDMKEKLDPYMQPLYDALRDMLPN
ncbi:MAG: PhoH family protein, partial [Flavobacterium sp.]|nr:PhoH family protein [Flavobacterium sp.]